MDAREVARILRPGGRFSSTEAAGDPDRVKRTELDAFAALAGLEKGESWSGLLVKTFNYNKPRSLAKARGSDFPQNRKMARRGR